MTRLFGPNKDWEAVIGLEIHAQIHSESKLFSSAPTKFGEEANTNVSLFDSATPGTLPILNKYCIEQAVKTGLAINAIINKISIFDRKHYFYPDLPNGYQISQFYHPTVGKGVLTIELENGKEKEIKIERIHVEQDAGKSIHDLDPKNTLIDLNRAGVGLMEIVSDPDISSPEEAVLYIKKLQLIMQYIGTCDGNMEKGNLRCDANVSVRKIGDKLGKRCEIKNLNSTSNIYNAIEYEINRQIKILENGGQIESQTRLFDVDNQETKKLRSKENAEDYKYFPDPDLLPIEITDEYIEKLKRKLPKLPDVRKKEYINYGLNHEVVNNLVNDIYMGNYFEQVLKNHIDPKLAANWINIEITSRMTKLGIHSFKECPISIENLSELLQCIEKQEISASAGKSVLDKMFENNTLNPKKIIENEGLSQISDISQIERMIDEVLLANSSQVEKYKNGETKLFGFFVGESMKKSKGKANPGIINEILKKKLS
jgi:aspartyl-tRNA(Asn)/glutamyl-tRNA(Gln) amidotransferase subunit B